LNIFPNKSKLPNGILLATSQNPGHTYGTILRSTDFGETWVPQYNPPDENQTLAICNNENVVCVGGGDNNGNRIYRSENYGETFIDLGSQHPGTQVNNIIYLKDEIWLAGFLYAGVGNTSAIFRSTNNGKTWNNVFSINTVNWFRNFVTLPNNHIINVTSSPAYILKSHDLGKTWKIITSFGTNQTINKVIHVKNGILFACTTHTSSLGKIYRSLDFGETWKLVYTNISGAAIINIVHCNGNIVAFKNSNFSVIVSNDMGNSWNTTFSTSDTGISNYEINPLGNLLCISTNATGLINIYTSFDFATTFKLVTSITTQNQSYFYKLNDKTAFVMTVGSGTNSGQIWKTTDSGQTWKNKFIFGTNSGIYSMLYLK